MKHSLTNTLLPRASDRDPQYQVLEQPAVATAECIPFPTEGFYEEQTSDVPDPLPWSKRALDITCILLALPSLLPLMGLLVVVIKLVSRGPVLFKQERVGYRGSRFLCFKFRSMTADTSTTVHKEHLSQLIGSNLPMAKLDARGDSRLIPGGRLLRASGLDELPQLINVLRGEMSLVGPRPCVPYEYDKFLPWQKKRFDAVPGLTGLWQVSGKNKTTFDEMIHLDIRYAQNRSLGLDVKIMLKTLPAVTEQIRDTAVRTTSWNRKSRVLPHRRLDAIVRD